jgi:uncharacterized protein YlxW (UPF0749 family)
MREREGLVARIRQVRQTAVRSSTAATTPRSEPDPPVVKALRARVEQLEQQVEALQDSVHRESTRHDRRMAELEARIQPAALGIALSRDARERGL